MSRSAYSTVETETSSAAKQSPTTSERGRKTRTSGTIVPLVLVFRPRSMVVGLCFAALLVSVSTVLYADRDTAPIFGHLSREAGRPHR